MRSRARGWSNRVRTILAEAAVLVALASSVVVAAPTSALVSEPDISAVAAGDLDAKAFQTFADGQSERIATLRVNGGAPARYARTHPEALYEALRPERAVGVLAFVLENGGDAKLTRSPTNTMPPLLATQLDPDKMRLLLDHGADPSARPAGYTILANILFSARPLTFPAVPSWNQPSRTFDKAEIVRLLLDHGVDPNGDHGGWGRHGAMGLTRPQDTTAIAALVAHGATLGDDTMGPLAMALQYDREDLAVALAARDGTADPRDRLALVEAARRGYRDAVQALLRAGADPNVADASGATALAMAARRRDKAMSAMLVAAGARPATPFKPALALPSTDPFDAFAADALDDVAFFDPPRFYPSLGVPKGPVRFGLPGKTLGTYEEIDCEQAVELSIVLHQSHVGTIKLGVCRRDAHRVREAAAATRTTDAELGKLLGVDLRALGGRYTRSVGSDGSDRQYTPVIVVGHGLLTFPTAVVTTRNGDRTAIVQLGTTHLCDSSWRIRTPLCDDSEHALTEIAARVLAR
jgi:hypothetical protein